MRHTNMDTTSAQRITRIVGAAAAAAWALPIAFIHLPTADADPCPDVEIVFARGTTEPPGVGGIGQAFVDLLRSQLGGRSVGVYAVDYPASRDFDVSTPAGANDASTHIQSMAANCPNTRMVLGGYSQGAGVIDLSTTAMPPRSLITSQPPPSSGLRRVRLRTHSPPARCPRSVLFTQPRPLTCACRTIRSAPTAGTCVLMLRTSRPGWSTRPQLSPRVGSRKSESQRSHKYSAPLRWLLSSNQVLRDRRGCGRRSRPAHHNLDDPSTGVTGRATEREVRTFGRNPTYHDRFTFNLTDPTGTETRVTERSTMSQT